MENIGQVITGRAVLLEFTFKNELKVFKLGLCPALLF